MLTREKIESLSNLSTTEWPTISLYLRIEKERTDDDFTIRLKNLLNDASDHLNGTMTHEQRAAVRADLDRVREFVRDEQSRFSRGLALFVNSNAHIWESLDIPAQVESKITIASETDVTPLIQIFERFEPFCTCLIARDQSRIFFGQMGQFEEILESRDPSVPGQHEQGGWAQARYERHIEEHVRNHFKETANALFQLSSDRPFNRLVLGGPEEVVASFVEFLHPYVRERYAGDIRLMMEANINDVHRESWDVVRRSQNEEKHRTIGWLLDHATDGRGAIGLESTLEMLQRGQIMTLIVDESLSVPGAVCQKCFSLQLTSAASGGECLYCGGPLREIENIVSRVVVEAFRQRCKIMFLDTDELREEAAEFGRIGALLRFAVEMEPTQ